MFLLHVICLFGLLFITYYCYPCAERRKQSYQLENLFNYYVKMLRRHHKQLSQMKVRESISQGLQSYPLNPELYSAFLEISYIYSVPSKLRWTFDDYCQK